MSASCSLPDLHEVAVCRVTDVLCREQLLNPKSMPSLRRGMAKEGLAASHVPAATWRGVVEQACLGPVTRATAKTDDLAGA